jgi:hypothetical protein
MEFWHVPPPLQRRLWQALGSARWSRASEWRQKLELAHGTVLFLPEKLLFDVCSPREVIGVIEALYHERRLDRRSTSLLEDCLLARTDQHGRWKGTPEAAGPAPRIDLNSAIYATLEGEEYGHESARLLFAHAT